jgi:hypothetical protein
LKLISGFFLDYWTPSTTYDEPVCIIWKNKKFFIKDSIVDLWRKL